MTDWLPGDVVLTAYGVGVIVRCPTKSTDNVPKETEFPSTSPCHFQLQMWRIPGKSIGTTSTAYLHPHSIIEKLPAAPGMKTTLIMGNEEQKVDVLSYYSQSHKFLVVPDDPEIGSAQSRLFTEVDPSQLKYAQSSKFYPLLVELMRRGDKAAKNTAALIHDEGVSKIVQKGVKYMEVKSEELMSDDAAKLSQENVDKLASAMSENLPNQDHMKQVYQMLRDEELTVLLRKGQERLQALMSTDVSKATSEALRKTGIVINIVDYGPSSFAEAITKSRDSALTALEELLKDAEVDIDDLNAARKSVESKFTIMFDNFAEAAKSDRALNNIFETISGKTSEWQQATGRLMSTKSGSLFLEGASRLRFRAQRIFSRSQLDWAGEVGSKLTKAFTEGDAAVARLKSIEMGDALRNRLVDAIELRSGSEGGLDAIIAGSLSSIADNGKKSGVEMQKMLTNLQSNAPGAAKDAHETLISVLSARSEYQDVALLRLENVFCTLDKHLGEGMTPQEIAAIASGEGGTAALLDPIAKRASTEISKHLDNAETTINDPTIIAALAHIRRIISGELTVSALMDEAVNILNDDSILAVGESFVKTGEIALDAIEGLSGNKIADDVMEMVERAGITKESLMSQLEALNVNEILDTAGNAVTDEKARQELVSSATDTALDFVLRILPSMPVPPFDGVKDGLLYNLSNLSLKGFKVKKEDIVVEIAGMRATKSKSRDPLREEATMQAWSFASLAPEVSSDQNRFLSPKSSIEVDKSRRVVKSTELLIIDVQRISAVLDRVEWSFEQTYMPYLKGGGKADVKLSGGSIRLQFELRKMKKKQVADAEIAWEPVLCLHNRTCTIEEVDLVLHGESRLTWIFNKLAALFKNALRDYVVKTIVGILTSKSGYILEQLNKNISPYWGLILRTTGLNLNELIEADENVVVSALPDEDEGLVELVWRQNLPLGMNLLLNDDSGRLKVVDFPRGSQARAVCADKELDPDVFKGATIVAVNGSKYEFQEDLFEALKNPARPKAILFELANPEDAERVKKFVERSRSRLRKNPSQTNNTSTPRVFTTNEVIFNDSFELGLEFAPTLDDFALAVKGFFEGEDGIVLAAERNGSIHIGDVLTHINRKLVLGEGGAGRKCALDLLEKEGQSRPLTLTFAPPHLFHQVFAKKIDDIADLGGPLELKLTEKNKRIVVQDFENVSGAAEKGGVLIGDHLIFINGQAVGAGCVLVGQHQPPDLSELYSILRESSNYPAALTFARPQQRTGSRWMGINEKFEVEAAETICITADSFDQIGCVFQSTRNLDIIVSDLYAVPGPFQLAMRELLGDRGILELAIESVNAQFVPSYANTSIVNNAMNRSWQSDNKVEVVFCDDEVKDWLRRLQ